jgi:hypothetical protein
MSRRLTFLSNSPRPLRYELEPSSREVDHGGMAKDERMALGMGKGRERWSGY